MVRLRPPLHLRPGVPATGASGRYRGGRRRPSLLSVHSVVGQMFLLQVVIVLLLAIGALLILTLKLQHETATDATDRSMAVAQGFASAPGTATALESPSPTAALQQRADAATRGADVDYVIVVNRQGIRYTSKDPQLIGKRATENMKPLLAGHVTQMKIRGALGEHYRSFVPVKDDRGRVVGAVGAGITVGSVSSAVARQVPLLAAGALGAVALTTGGAALLSRRLLRQTHGLGPSEITRLYEHHDAVLHVAKEGILITDGKRCVVLANDEAQRLLDLPPDHLGRHVSELGLPPSLADVMGEHREATDEVHVAGGRVLAVNQRPLDRAGGPTGCVMTLRDTTELQALTGKAERASGRLKMLYDASMGIGTALDVRRTAEELAEAAVPRFADFATVDLAEPVLYGGEPDGSQQELLRVALVGVRDDAPLFPVGARIRWSPDAPQARCLNCGRAVMEADLRRASEWGTQASARWPRVAEYGIESLISAPMSARGTRLGVANFWRMQGSPAFEDDDVALAEELAARAAVSVDNARRYTREHSMAVTLQRSLLPSRLPEQNALDVAYRYLPAQKSVGGDWFDVIPLPGARVALVVGDVVGQGVRAAVTMGRLRTAVHALSAMDLPPDELLANLDELAGMIDREETSRTDDAIVGATCVYAIYDSVDRRCTLARAGHLPPALVRPDGAVEFLEIPAGPPLGVGGLPFETAEVVVPEGSRLVLYTDGLVEDRRQDIDEGLGVLRATLAAAPADPEETCSAVLHAMLPGRSADDTALLVARTRVLPRSRVAEWEVPPDPSAVCALRRAVSQRLASWRLGEFEHTTGLIVSELVTNALRYASGPIGVRLLLDRQLVCEVSDRSSTAPHLGRAAVMDEGGRGLFLVARLSERWGTRYTADGKVIWAEQPLPTGYRPPEPAGAPSLPA